MNLIPRKVRTAMRRYRRRTPAQRAWDELFRRLKSWNRAHGRK